MNILGHEVQHQQRRRRQHKASSPDHRCFNYEHNYSFTFWEKQYPYEYCMGTFQLFPRQQAINHLNLERKLAKLGWFSNSRPVFNACLTVHKLTVGVLVASSLLRVARICWLPTIARPCHTRPSSVVRWRAAPDERSLRSVPPAVHTSRDLQRWVRWAILPSSPIAPPCPFPAVAAHHDQRVCAFRRD